MRKQPLAGLKVLLVEDDPIIALDVEDALVEAGAEVIGPVHTLKQAIRAAETGAFDLAVLDIDLGRDEVFPAAEILSNRHIPYLFYTGMPDRAPLQDRFSDVPVCPKPSPHAHVLDTLGGLIDQAA